MSIDVVLDHDRVRINLPLDEWRDEDLISVYNAFCAAHEFAPRSDDAQQLVNDWKEGFDRWGIDFRPYMGAKFFGSLTRDPAGMEFHGYCNADYPTEHDGDFFQRVREYFAHR